MSTGQRSLAFSLVELVVVCVVVTMACMIAWPGAKLARSQAGLAGSLANLKKIGEVTGNYAADYQDAVWGFSWQSGDTPSQYDDLDYAADGLRAVSYQAVDIVRRRYNEDLPSYSNRFGSYWISTLVLADYLDESLPMEWVVSPGDKIRLEWQADPDNPPDLNDQGGEAWANIFCGFGSSYELMPAFFAPDERIDSNRTIWQYSSRHDLTQMPTGLEFGGRRVGEVLFPSQKVHMAERASFFFGPTPAFYMLPEARVPVLMVDGSASPRTTADANASFYPNIPDDLDRTSITDYMPNPVFEVPTLSGGSRDNDIETYYKWTRRGLRGIDFNGERAE